jgi:hypothetical protein
MRETKEPILDAPCRHAPMLDNVDCEAQEAISAAIGDEEGRRFT